MRRQAAVTPQPNKRPGRKDRCRKAAIPLLQTVAGSALNQNSKKPACAGEEPPWSGTERRGVGGSGRLYLSAAMEAWYGRPQIEQVLHVGPIPFPSTRANSRPSQRWVMVEAAWHAGRYPRLKPESRNVNAQRACSPSRPFASSSLERVVALCLPSYSRKRVWILASAVDLLPPAPISDLPSPVSVELNSVQAGLAFRGQAAAVDVPATSA